MSNDNQSISFGRVAVAHFAGSEVNGNVWFAQLNQSSPVQLVGNLSFVNFQNSRHGLHVHEFGDLTQGAHFNPFNQFHGSLTSTIRHVGDFGNIRTGPAGRASFTFTLPSNVTLYENNSIVGRALVVHRDRDDLGRGSNPDSRITGNSGPRIGCAVIGLTSEPRCAVAYLTSNDVKGSVWFSQKGPSSCVKLTGTLEFTTAKNSYHGFHVHEFGDLTEGCTSAGAHYNPFSTTHGSLNSTIRHVGDFGNIFADACGKAEISLDLPSDVTLYGDNSIIGRALVIHQNKDDLGQGGDEESLKTGNAGARIGCAVIGHARCRPA